MKKLMMMLFVLASVRSTAQDKNKLAMLDIRTSAICEMCQKTIEGGLIYEKGVQKVDLDLETNTIHVAYNPKKIDPQKIRVAVTKLGYAADKMPADPKAFKELSSCCQKHDAEKPEEKH